MTAIIFDGRALAQDILANVTEFITKDSVHPVLAIILVGDNEGSLAYIRQKLRFASQVGIETQVFHFKTAIDQATFHQAIQDIQDGGKGEWQAYLVGQTRVKVQRPDAVIVQRPLPNGINYRDILSIIDPKRDIDGFHPDSPFTAPVAQAVVEILYHIFKPWESNTQITELLKHKKVVLIGHGETAGKPISQFLDNLGIEHDIITHTTANPKSVSSKADVIISAVGKPHIITKDWVKPGAMVIDVGISRIPHPETDKVYLSGDIDPQVQEVASVVTPVPGGVGPVNVACLMKNVLLTVDTRV